MDFFGRSFFISKICIFCGLENKHEASCPIHPDAPEREIKKRTFKIGEIVVLRGMCFKIYSITKKRMRLRLWK